MIKKTISSLLTLTLLICSTFGVSMLNASGIVMGFNTSKISPELKNAVNCEELSVYIWFKDSIDINKINEEAEKAVGFTQEYLEKIEK